MTLARRTAVRIALTSGLVIVAALLETADVATNATLRYQVTDLGVGSGWYLRLNNAEQPQVLSLGQETTQFLSIWQNGVTTRLPGPATNFLTAIGDLNDRGEVVGAIYDTRIRPIVWRRGERVELQTDLGVDLNRWESDASCSPTRTDGRAHAINSRGDIVGTVTITCSKNPSRRILHTAVRWHNGGVTILPGPQDARYVLPLEINSDGTVVGVINVADGANARSMGALWRHGGLVGGLRSVPLTDINDVGQVTQASDINAVSTQTQSILGGTAINDYGHVVGQHIGGPYLWRSGAIERLQELIPADSGWTLDSVSDINNRDEIVGWGRYRGERRAFLLKPDRRGEIEIELTTFIPANHIPIRPLWCGGPPNGPIAPQTHFLVGRGDDRWFDLRAATYRTRQLVTVIPDQSVDPLRQRSNADGLKVGSIQLRWHPTKLYASDALPVVDASDDDEPGDCHLFHDEVPPVIGADVEVIRRTPGQSRVILTGRAGSSTTGELMGYFCAINWQIVLDVFQSGDVAWVHRVAGGHSGFPAFELHVQGREIYRYSPGQPPYGWDELFSLCFTTVPVLPELITIKN